MIRTTYPDRVRYRSGCDVHKYRVLLLEGVRIAWRRMSFLGIRMELIRIALRAPSHQEDRSLHLAYADSPPCDAQISPSQNSIRSYISGSSDNAYPESIHGRHSTFFFSEYFTSGTWRRMGEEAFQLPRSDISGSSYSAHLESFAAIFCTVPQCSP